jgi:hypothetical protein
MRRREARLDVRVLKDQRIPEAFEGDAGQRPVAIGHALRAALLVVVYLLLRVLIHSLVREDPELAMPGQHGGARRRAVGALGAVGDAQGVHVCCEQRLVCCREVLQRDRAVVELQALM